MKKNFLLFFCLFLLLSASLTLFALAGASSDEEITPIAEGGQNAERYDMIKSGLSGRTLTFASADFDRALGTTDYASITVTALPSEEAGTLALGEMKVQVGQTVKREYLSKLTFSPKSKDTGEAFFSFTACDADGGAIALGASLECHVRLLESVNETPTATGTSAVQTMAGVPVFGTLGASDPEGDALTYILTKAPAHGTVTQAGSDAGSFRYLPTSGYTGSDSFRYVVRDEYGNYSKECTVSVTVRARVVDLEYKDMENNVAYNAALTAAAEAWMLGSMSGNGMYFNPNQTVSRGEFVAMALKACKIPLSGLTDTCFDDNDSIPSSVRSYVAEAQERGFVVGSFEGDGLYFHADKPITRAEAAVILYRILKPDTPSSAPVFEDADSIPVYAQDAIAALADVGVYDTTESVAGARESLTRQSAAMMLYAVHTAYSIIGN